MIAKNMKYHIPLLSLLFIAFSTFSVYAQKAERKSVKEGNKHYIENKFTEAEIAYRKSLEVNPRSLEGTYNLGNALYKQDKLPEAAEQYKLMMGQTERLLKEDPTNAKRISQVFHNLGNVGMKSKDYQTSIEAYKQSLRLNPQDNETRYNLALAQKLLKDQEGGGQDDNENKDENDDQNQDEQQQQQQQQDQKENKTQEEQQPNEQMSKDNAQQILDALLQDEKDTQEKVKKVQQQKNQQRKIEKQW